MPIYYYWGEDDHQIKQSAQQLIQQVVDPHWQSFNYQKVAGDALEVIQNALAESRTLPFGSGGRLTWISDAPLGTKCPEELGQTLLDLVPNLPEHSHVLFTGVNKLPVKSKVGQLFTQQGKVQEFTPIPPWKTEALAEMVRDTAQSLAIALKPDAVDYLVEAVGNDRYRLAQELQKIALLRPNDPRPLSAKEIQPLVPATTQTSLALAQAIRLGQTDMALNLLDDLLTMAEPPLRVTATLVSQFRLWLWVKLMQVDKQVDAQKVAAMTNLGNPKRIYFLEKEVRSLPLAALTQTLELLFEMELGIKRGAPAAVLLPTRMILLCGLYSRVAFPAQ
ncbi:DNA polymerase III subunit delta [Gloeomargarita lithophora Alchichica-D10]|uniref:DNA polymerase III subunit delta n=1 Tax=Gloeomargarita lithophora Alchichica-D10 TaxID=1188229 RepID=A0A1J0A9E8_9CYAN|nr:DNA polymerase III subunit delta [Gloeomargarita lithophora]APB32555.1 DNA polymerase III subunit delta [Gloeomargarita lithophora Alchichica-D10]